VEKEEEKIPKCGKKSGLCILTNDILNHSLFSSKNKSFLKKDFQGF